MSLLILFSMSNYFTYVTASTITRIIELGSASCNKFCNRRMQLLDDRIMSNASFLSLISLWIINEGDIFSISAKLGLGVVMSVSFPNVG